MSDVVRDFIEAPFVVITDEEILNRRKYKLLALAALDAEREAHAKEVDELKKYKLMYQSGPRCQCSDDEACGHVLRAEKAEKEVADLRKRIAELEAQLQDER